MSLGTPGASASFPGGQIRQQFQRNWGNYASAATLPNGAGNILAAANFRLEAGDLAYVIGSGQYSCTSAGTAGGGDAVWVLVPASPTGGGTDNHLVRWDGTGALQDGIAIEDDLGVITATGLVVPLGAAGAGNLAIQIGSAAQQGVYADNNSLFFTNNSAALVGFNRFASTDYFFSWTNRNLVAGTNTGYQSWVTGASMTGHAFTNQGAQMTGGAGVSQGLMSLATELNQSATAAFTALSIAITETALGSGAQYAINVKTGAAGATQVFSVRNTGTVQASAGTAADPGVGIGSFTFGNVMGFARMANTIISVVQAGVDYIRFDVNGFIAFQQANFRLSQDVTNNALQIGGNVTSGSASSLLINNSASYTGGAGALQIGAQFAYTVNQSSTAAFTALDIAITETATGSSAQYLINAKTGAAGATQVFAVTRAGVSSSTGENPLVSATYDLGTSSLLWRDLYLSGNIRGANFPVSDRFFSGLFTGAVGATSNYAADGGVAAATVVGQVGYPMPRAVRIKNLYVNPIANTLGGNSTITVYKNNVATAITVTVNAASTATVSDTTHTADFAVGDELDLVITETGVGAMSFSATVELTVA